MTGLRHQGVPPGGAFDGPSFELANALLGNPEWATGLELAGVSATFECIEAGWAGWAGHGHEIEVDGRVYRRPCRVSLKQGQALTVRATRTGLRSYLSAPGGWDSRLVPGVVEPLRQQDSLRSSSTASCAALDEGPTLDEPTGSSVLRYIAVGESGRVRATVDPRLDRVGVRLSAPVAPVRDIGRPSRPCTLGTIQVTPAGGLLIHGPDGPTLGGYAQMGQVIRADHGVLAQLRPGGEAVLTPVSVDEALDAWRGCVQAHKKLLESVRPEVEGSVD